MIISWCLPRIHSHCSVVVLIASVDCCSLHLPNLHRSPDEAMHFKYFYRHLLQFSFRQFSRKYVTFRADNITSTVADRWVLRVAWLHFLVWRRQSVVQVCLHAVLESAHLCSVSIVHCLSKPLLWTYISTHCRNNSNAAGLVSRSFEWRYKRLHGRRGCPDGALYVCFRVMWCSLRSYIFMSTILYQHDTYNACTSSVYWRDRQFLRPWL